jgi:hypothetical protein
MKISFKHGEDTERDEGYAEESALFRRQTRRLRLPNSSVSLSVWSTKDSEVGPSGKKLFCLGDKDSIGGIPETPIKKSASYALLPPSTKASVRANGENKAELTGSELSAEAELCSEFAEGGHEAGERRDKYAGSGDCGGLFLWFTVEGTVSRMSLQSGGLPGFCCGL